MIHPQTLSNPILKRLAAALGASLWVETPDALVFGRHVTAALLVHWPSVSSWWRSTLAHLEYPEVQSCTECGHGAYEGRGQARVEAPRIGPVYVSVSFLGHDHAGGDNEQEVRSIYLIESIKLAEHEIAPQILAETSVLFASALAPSSTRVAELDGDSELDDYLSSMGHRLRTQLTNLLGYSELLLEEDFGQGTFANRAVRRIERSGREVLGMVDALELHLVREHAKRKLARTLRRVSVVLASSLDLNEVIVKIHESIAQLTHFDRSRLLWVHEGYLEVAETETTPSERIDIDAPPFDQVFEDLPNIQYIAQVDHDAIGIAADLGSEYNSWLCLPLIGSKGPLALITLASKGAESYDDLDLDILNAFAHHAFLALSNARQYSETRKLVELDPLTQALSRNHFYELAQRKFDEARRLDEPLSLMMFDVDHFKQVNDAYGHTVGDLALKHVVDHAQLALRPVDLLGRYGGEEFVVLLPGVGLQVAMGITDRVRRRISLTEVEANGERFSITISAGVATFHPDYDVSVEALIERADGGLYRAKAAGRDQVCAEELDPVTEKMTLE